ncbi:hypothetical protein C6369_021265 [Rhodococcus rhodochrous]|uniref:hypothetical protein n=1 Tax=Rhodococcus rhodochrous TaxID=1829 RepID=UPI000D06D361|nr:hypothetical protein [Rhodococcus rhodochrous]AYA26717.1 hypothetical protein C6369_021265 [Rhodococcus rhodochrous]
MEDTVTITKIEYAELIEFKMKWIRKQKVETARKKRYKNRVNAAQKEAAKAEKAAQQAAKAEELIARYEAERAAQ